MEVRLLKKSVIKTEEFYKDFLDDQIKLKDEYFETKSVFIDNAPDFPIYIAKDSEEYKRKLFHEAFDTISKYYLNTDRDIHFYEMFWYSLFCVYKRDYLIKEYPEIQESISKFHNIVLKKFDWENYIYKCILGSEYINDNVDEDQRSRYYDLIIDNLDLYNYILKAEIFRNGPFLVNILDIIDEYDLSSVLKAKIKDRPDLGKDERYGRRVVYEFNKSYPIVMSPMMSKKELVPFFFEYLSYYYDVRKLEWINL